MLCRVSVLIGILLLANDAGAQAIFVSAGYHRDVKRFSGDPDLNVLDTEADGLQVAVSTLVSPRLAVALEVGLSGESTVALTNSVLLGGRSVDVTTTYRNQLRTVSVLMGLRGAPAGRLQLTYLSGLTFAHVRRRIEQASRAAILQPAPPPTPSVLVDNVPAATAGIDLAIQVVDHIAAIASLRAHALRISADLAGFSIRPEFGAQFSF